MAKRVIDYAFKSRVLNEYPDLIKKAKISTKVDYAISELNNNGTVMPILRHDSNDIMSSIDLMNYCRDNGLLNVLQECYRINDASYKRVKRLKDRIQSMLLNGACLFLTLTFTDDTLQNTTDKERRVAVSRYLKSFGCSYVANVDYGKENHREHYHAIINTNKIDLAGWRKYGNINVKHIRNRDIAKSNTRLAKYICKLSNHAVKETTKRSALIYSR